MAGKINLCVEVRELVLSIITVVKNDYERLSKTVASLADYYGDSNFEHIIIDGVSTDRTLDFIHQLNAKVSIKILSEPDTGIYDAMNKGINLASGKYLLFLNAGDCMKIGSVQLNQWLQAAPLNIDILCFPALLRKGAKVLSLLPDTLTRHRMPTSHQAMIFSKKFVSSNLYNSTYKVAGDFDLYLRAQKNNVLIYPTDKFLSEVELEGYASKNPAIAYKEYIKIVYKRLSGISRFLCLLRICSWAVIIIPLKKLFPEKVLSAWRNWE